MHSVPQKTTQGILTGHLLANTRIAGKKLNPAAHGKSAPPPLDYNW